MPRTLAQGLAFLLGFACALWLGPARISTEPLSDPEATRLEELLLEQVNGVRAQWHLVPLARMSAVDDVARGHSGDMAARGYLAHESPEGHNAIDRLARGRVDGFSLAAENIGQTSKPTPASEIVAAWLRSPVHRTNLLAPAFNATGIGVARARDGSWIATQLYLTYPR
jgi:uncharacterized protein YkwD